MSASSDEDRCLTPEESREQVSDGEFSSSIGKSHEKYLKAYELFNNWRLSQCNKTYSETLLLSYFMELSKTRQPSTLWSVFSMLKAVLKIKRDLNIETYPKLLSFIKKNSEGYKPKKSKVFTASEIEKFLNEAPDSIYLGLKVGFIIGIHGACRANELLNLTVNDIEKPSDELILVKLLDAKTKIDRSFIIRDNYVNIINKYMALRPARTKTTRLFLQYGNGKCKVQPMGINKIGEMPRKIATFLELEDPHLYSGHCLRRTSSMLIGHHSGADLTVLKRHGGSNANAVAEVYIEDPIDNNSIENLIESSPVSPGSSDSPLHCTNIKTEILSNTQVNNIVHPSSSKEYIILPNTQVNNTLPSTSKEYIIESRPISPCPSASPPDGTYVKPENTELPNTHVNNTTIKIPNKNVTFHLHNCSNITFKF